MRTRVCAGASKFVFRALLFFSFSFFLNEEVFSFFLIAAKFSPFFLFQSPVFHFFSFFSPAPPKFTRKKQNKTKTRQQKKKYINLFAAMQAPAAEKQRIRDAEMRKLYANAWKTDLMHSPCENPPFCVYAAFCSCCVAFQQRKKQMYGSLQGYTCCNGGSCISGKCGERNNPELCLCCEVCLCFPSAVATTRYV